MVWCRKCRSFTPHFPKRTAPHCLVVLHFPNRHVPLCLQTQDLENKRAQNWRHAVGPRGSGLLLWGSQQIFQALCVSLSGKIQDVDSTFCSTSLSHCGKREMEIGKPSQSYFTLNSSGTITAFLNQYTQILKHSNTHIGKCRKWCLRSLKNYCC